MKIENREKKKWLLFYHPTRKSRVRKYKTIYLPYNFELLCTGFTHSQEKRVGVSKYCCSLPCLLTRSLIPCRIFSRCSSIFLCLTRRSCSPCLIASCLNFSCSAAFSLSSGVVSSPPTEGIWPRIRN